MGDELKWLLKVGVVFSRVVIFQGVVIPIGAVVTAATGVKKQSRGQGLFLVSVKRSRTIFKLGNSGQDVYVLRVRIAHSVVKCVRSNGQSRICGAVKRSSNKNDGQNISTPVAAVTTAPIGVTTPCISLENSPISHAVSLALFVCACSDSAMPFLSCASLCNNSKWCLPSFASPSSCNVLLLQC